MNFIITTYLSNIFSTICYHMENENGKSSYLKLKTRRGEEKKDPLDPDPHAPLTIGSEFGSWRPKNMRIRIPTR
jgi:hypothetical protein